MNEERKPAEDTASQPGTSPTPPNSSVPQNTNQVTDSSQPQYQPFQTPHQGTSTPGPQPMNHIPQYNMAQSSPIKPKERTITLKLPVFIIMIAAIIVALIVGIVAGISMSSIAVNEANTRAATSEADRKKIADAYDQVMSQIEQESQQAQQEQQQSAKSEAVTVTGGRWKGDTTGTGYGEGVVTVRNDGDKPLSIITVTVAKLDAGGKVTGETYPQMQSALQPGQSADIEFMIGPDEQNVTHAQATAISYASDKNGTGFTQYNVYNAPKIAVK
ncbi:FxLYD domain-containing protein [Bifidobacterium simiarum]|uniref:FxLYD domain-containing protein n=1 Tax=Bifidobacterium simiarum TaxID=2045441 RepID=UPI001BDD19B7|nr:FxLYD domain-containing protein [Bifidobacterium simiarum]MBT1165963.1 hypothetical protein [Bifidobacterium simiarum]